MWRDRSRTRAPASGCPGPVPEPSEYYRQQGRWAPAYRRGPAAARSLLLSTSRPGWATAAAAHVKAIRRREAHSSSAASLHLRPVERLAAAARLRAAPGAVE